MFRKMLFCLFLTLIMIGFVSAADITSFKAPEGFEDIGDGIYIKYDDSHNPDLIIAVVAYTETDADDYLLNDTDYGYLVYESQNNTYNFIDNNLTDEGSFELIEVDGDMFIIDTWYTIGSDGKDFNATFDNLMEFNKVNNVEAINASEIGQA